MPNQNPGNLQAKVMHAITGDPKKTLVLGLLIAMLGFMVVRMVVSKGGGRPAAAVASLLKLPGTTGKSAPKPTSNNQSNPFAAAIQKWSEGPVPPVSRNLFNVRVEYFPVDGSRTTKSDGEDEGFWARLEKSITSKADLRDKRENLIANYKNQASQLRLQSTVMGPEPRAMINGELVGEGSVVAAFRVTRIEARKVVVEREGIRLEIQMK